MNMETAVLALLTAGLYLMIAALAILARRVHRMAIDVTGVQTELAALVDRVATLETSIIPGITQDYQTLKGRIETLEAALAGDDPVAVQAALDAIKSDMAQLGGRLAAANAALGALDNSVPPPPSPETPA